ncbi:MAG: hypothetical protein AB7T59_10270 [Hyphomonadaceae bacterium]
MRKAGAQWVAAITALGAVVLLSWASAQPRGADIAGTYDGSFDGGSGTIVISGTPPRLRLVATMAGMRGCGGRFDGPAAVDAQGRIVATARDYSGACRFIMTPSGDLWTIEEDGPGCTGFHGASCSFGGGEARRRGANVQSTPGAGQSIASLAGLWRGTYTCGQGQSGIDLSIRQTSGSAVEATFDFYPTPLNPNARTGAFTMRGSYVSSTGRISLAPVRWLNQPAGYTMVGVEAQRTANVIEGRIIGPNCTTIRVSRN